MKSNVMVRGSGAGLAAVIQIDTTIGFLADRQQVIDLTRVSPAASASFVWKRVFLRGKGGPRH